MFHFQYNIVAKPRRSPANTLGGYFIHERL
jgi:hypothetical protein